MLSLYFFHISLTYTLYKGDTSSDCRLDKER